MCDCIELTVRLDENAGTDTLALPLQSAFRLPEGEGRLWCLGAFPNYHIANGGGCGCGAIEGREGGPARLIPTHFIGYDLELFPVDRVELLWWFGSDDNRPIAPPVRKVPWREFQRVNEEMRLEGGVLYEISKQRLPILT